MTTAAEFWGYVLPNGKTAAEDLVDFWQRVRDCVHTRPPPSLGGGGGSFIRPKRRKPAEQGVLRTRELLDEEEIMATILAAYEVGLFD